MIQVYTGNGKGKTTAALGLAVRAAGHGLKVGIIQFLKGSTYSGELVSLHHLDIEIFQFGRTCPHSAVIKSGLMECQQCGDCFIGLHDINDSDRNKVNLAWQLAQDFLRLNTYNLLILDEILTAVSMGLINLDELLAFLNRAGEKPEIILTGREAPQEIIAAAHLVTEMRKIKHPYDGGFKSRRGIEY